MTFKKTQGDFKLKEELLPQIQLFVQKKGELRSACDLSVINNALSRWKAWGAHDRSMWRGVGISIPVKQGS